MKFWHHCAKLTFETNKWSLTCCNKHVMTWTTSIIRTVYWDKSRHVTVQNNGRQSWLKIHLLNFTNIIYHWGIVAQRSSEKKTSSKMPTNKLVLVPSKLNYPKESAVISSHLCFGDPWTKDPAKNIVKPLLLGGVWQLIDLRSFFVEVAKVLNHQQ